jgi:glutathione peroxidase
MKLVITIIAAFICISFTMPSANMQPSQVAKRICTYTESVYTHSVMSIEGVNKPLSAYQNKKIFVIVLPTTQNASNDSLLNSIDSLRVAQGSNVQIIGVPAYEFGYTVANKTALQTWYRTKLNTAIIITEGLYVKKSSGTQQHPLFKWLTDKDKNGYLNDEVEGARNKYIIWTDGQLAGDFAPATKMNGAAMQSMF